MKYLLSLPYLLAAKTREALYRRGLFRAKRLPRPVISVGNLTLGGTGKTPLVILLSRALLQGGYHPVILSRGYKGRAEHTNLLVSDGGGLRSTPSEAGDEPYLLARSLPGAKVVVGKNRYAGAQLAGLDDPKAVYLLDDGFQHLQLYRDLDILVIDATNPFDNGLVLPVGRLREPKSAIVRADIIAVTRAHLAEESDDLELEIRRHNRAAPIWYFYHDAVSLTDVRTGQTEAIRRLQGARIVALAGIGNPAVFLTDLAHYGCAVVESLTFRDHHAFSQRDVDRAVATMHSSGAEAIVTTEKDAVRLGHLRLDSGVFFSFNIAAKADDEDQFSRQFLEEVRIAAERSRG